MAGGFATSCCARLVMIFVVTENRNASLEYFLQHALSTSDAECEVLGFDSLPKTSALQDGVVIFVRYVPSGWVRLIDAERHRLRQIVFFMDDDVLDIRASVGMPFRYRLKLARLAAMRKNWLLRHGVRLWVSTPWLLRKYESWGPRLLYPTPALDDRTLCRVFYHGSASHNAEIRWLRQVVGRVLDQHTNLVFEVIGGSEVYRLYRGLPRVTVVHPMQWPAYQAFVGLGGRHIGLAPLLDLPFNRARGYTKFFDITRCGAVGIYSAGTIFDDVIANGVDGFLLPLSEDAWVSAILKLADCNEMRGLMFQNAKMKEIELTDRARHANFSLLDF